MSLLKKHTFIVNIAFTIEHFDFMDLFRFLQGNAFDYEQLNAFEDIYLPFCKKFPQKVHTH